MNNAAPQHLVTVWNPRYASDAMEAHLRLLLDGDAKATAGTANPDPLHETHLYLTDWKACVRESVP